MKYGVIGSGNLASHLVKALTKSGHPPAFLISRNPNTGKRLSIRSGAPLLDEPPVPGRSTPLLLICTHDDAIPGIFKKFAHSGYILIHFSGALPMIKLKNNIPGSGVLWPVQSFSANMRPIWKTIPLCLEASNETTRRKLHSIAKLLGGPVSEIDSRQRAKVHLAAVFANNFVNAQFTMAKQLLKEEGLDFDMLKPLILQTTKSIFNASPEDLQTGPARRGDQAVIQKQGQMLNDQKEIKAAYAAITAYLLKLYHP